MSQPPDPYRPGAGQDAVQPPPGQPYGQPPGEDYGPPPGQPYGPPPGEDYGQPGQPYGQPGPGLTPAPPVSADYGYGQYPDVMPPGMYLDQASGVVMPEGTQLASAGRRIGAYFLALPLAIVTLGIGYIVWGLLIWGNGQTPALQVLGMRVWQPDTGTVPGFWRMALREIVGRFVEGLLSIITELTSFVLFVASKDHKSLHDHIAGTVVLYDPDKVLAR